MLLREMILFMLFAAAPLLSVSGGAGRAYPFQSVTVTNGLSYSRTGDFHHDESDYPNSRLGMNRFSGRDSSDEEIAEAAYGVLHFLKYTYAAFMDNRGLHAVEVWNLQGGTRLLKGEDQFPALPDREMKFRESRLKDLRIVAFPFTVANRVSDGALDMILLKIYSGKQFRGACYYNGNTAVVSFSFIEASGNEQLVGHESTAPYLTTDERLVQEELHRDFEKRRQGPRRYVFPSLHFIHTLEMDAVSKRGE